MKHCPQCGSKLPNEQVKFCPDCGYKLLSQAESDYNIVCPDCKTAISNVNEDCPICGCPSSLFIKQTKTSSLCGEVMECPDCGEIFREAIPAECPNCGCPSSNFKMHEEKNVNTSSTQQGNIPKRILIIVSIIAVIGGFMYFAYNMAQAAEQARQEQYAKEQQERREREEQYAKEQQERREREEARRVEQENERFLNQIVGTYISPYKYYNGEYIRYRISLDRSKRYTIEILGYNYLVLTSQSGNFSPVAKECGCVLNPNTSNSSWIDVVGSHLEWGDIDLY